MRDTSPPVVLLLLAAGILLGYYAGLAVALDDPPAPRPAWEGRPHFRLDNPALPLLGYWSADGIALTCGGEPLAPETRLADLIPSDARCGGRP